ncbi:esterase [Massilia sp. PWRC2]|uniref:alpha-L-rhamnosidase-related protein n=1 Tax=Massilia sp. PWRC2 TaxID=2804626 RepID=UPI003CF3778E
MGRLRLTVDTPGTAGKLAILAIFASSFSSHAAPAPLPQALFVRGGFNGWGTSDALIDVGAGRYQARITIYPGYHGFKLGSADWSTEWTIAAAIGDAISPGADTPLLTHAGAETHLFVRAAGSYLFTVDVSAAPAPQLRVERLGAAPAASAGGPDPHSAGAGVISLDWPTWDGQHDTTRFSSPKPAAALRDYTISTTMTLRDRRPPFVRLRERPADAVSRSGNLAFDALFALANHEMHQDAVSAIRDGNYNGGQPIACACFETGEQWHYVWTRDLSYAADLGLALLEPARVMRSLDFKLSPWRAGLVQPAAAGGSADGLQILQDTGSGGSWPVSTDRVAWAFGAARVLDLLDGARRAAFAARALRALVNTVENDRLAAFDGSDGLYRGEASFLDWREQSYSSAIGDDIASLASSKALSTNLAHFKALGLTAALAREQGRLRDADKYRHWAGALKDAINARFWLADAGMYASLTAAHFDGAPLHKFDWLGQSLAIVSGVAERAQTDSILAHYPHGPNGPPVIFPQQPGQPIYHNRAIWPFVTAYGLRAAAIGKNVAVADAAYASLIRGAALNLSNVENLEWLSGQPLLLDDAQPALSGPVINSRRQLWSVGAYLGMVIESVFGVTADASGVQLKPFITSRLRRQTFGAAERIALRGLRLRDKTIEVVIELPPAEQADGYYAVAGVTVDGVRSAGAIAWQRLRAHSRIVLRLGRLQAGRQAITLVAGAPDARSPALYAPAEPQLRLAGPGRVAIADAAAGTSTNLYRDGVQIASGLAAGTYAIDGAGGCYTAEAVFAQSANRSHHSQPLCSGTAIEVAIADAGPWGAPGASRRIDGIEISSAGRYQVQLRYYNGSNQINLGISSGVKRLSLIDGAGATIAAGVLVLPHTRAGASGSPANFSTPLTAQLAAGSYSARLDDFYNMSYLEANRNFSGAGGVAGPSNQFTLFGIRLRKASASGDLHDLHDLHDHHDNHDNYTPP